MNLLDMADEGFLLVAILATLIQVSPIKINPWSFIAKKIGKAINGEVVQKVDKLSTDVEDLRETFDEKEADAARMRILRFNDEILHKTLHSKEHFDQVLLDISRYEAYCNCHPNYQNNIANMAIDLVKRQYKKCGVEGTFL